MLNIYPITKSMPAPKPLLIKGFTFFYIVGLAIIFPDASTPFPKGNAAEPFLVYNFLHRSLFMGLLLPISTNYLRLKQDRT